MEQSCIGNIFNLNLKGGEHVAIKKGDFVSWKSSGGISKGKVIKIVKDGDVEGIDGDVKITGTKDSPASLIEVYKDTDGEYKSSGTMVGHKIDTLKKIDNLNVEINEDNFDDDLSIEEINAYEDLDFTIPEGVQKSAQRGLELRKEYGRGGTSVGMGSARRLSKGGIATSEFVRKVAKYFPRHAGDNLDEINPPSNGRIAWLLWGGDAGRTWSEKLVNAMNSRDEKEQNTKPEINIISNNNNTYIEICEMPEGDISGRTKIKMSSHIIHSDKIEWNKNGITWLEEFTQENIKSAIGMPYVVDWLYTKEEGIPSGHGKQTYDSDGNVQFEGDTVGTVQDAYIDEVELNIETDDGVVKEKRKVMVTEGFLFNQRYPNFIKWIKEAVQNEIIYGSIEINGKAKSKTIEYLDGNKNPDNSPKMGRIPTIFDFTGLAILSCIECPADDNSQVIEVNSKQDNLNINNINNNLKGGEKESMKLISKGKTIEINNLTSWEIEKLLEKAFRIAIGDIFDSEEHGYYVDKLYPINAEFIIRKWSRNEISNFYKSSYSVDENNNVTLGDIYEVEEAWVPANNEKPIEMSNKGGSEMDKELQAKYEAMAKDLEVMSANYETMKANYENMAKEKEVMMKEMEEKNAKMSEVNEALVNANKMMEESNAKCETMMEEMNGYKEKYETMMAEKNTAEAEAEKATKLAEVNTYFETEISKNGFEEAEVNTLKSFVETLDLDGLKRAEAELCAKKFKEMVAKNANTDTEVNSVNDMFISIKEKEMKKVPGSIPSFFN